MAFVATPDTAQFVVVHHDASEEFFYNTLYLRDTVLPWISTKLVTAATALGNAWRDAIMPNLHQDTTFDRLEYRDIGAEFGVSGSIEYNQAGGNTGEGMPALNCVLVRIACSPGSPPRSGRLFLSRMGESDSNGDSWSPTLISNLNTDLATLLAAKGAASEAHVRVSRQANNVARDPYVTNTVASMTARSLTAVLKDRGRP